MGRKIKSVKVVMIMTLLFCVFLCPHGTDAALDEAVPAESAIECQHECESENHGHRHECELDILHSHEFRDDRSGELYPDFSRITWSVLVILPEQSQRFVQRDDAMARICSHTFAVRHLNTIILRV